MSVRGDRENSLFIVSGGRLAAACRHLRRDHRESRLKWCVPRVRKKAFLLSETMFRQASDHHRMVRKHVDPRRLKSKSRTTLHSRAPALPDSVARRRIEGADIEPHDIFVPFPSIEEAAPKAIPPECHLLAATLASS